MKLDTTHYHTQEVESLFNLDEFSNNSELKWSMAGTTTQRKYWSWCVTHLSPKLLKQDS